MKRGTAISLVALLVAMVGALVAFAAYLKTSRCMICDGYDDDFLIDDDEEYCGIQHDKDAERAAELHPVEDEDSSEE